MVEAPTRRIAHRRVEAVYREHAADLWRTLLAYSGNADVASDAVAETFAQALRRGEELRHPERWVWKTAFRVAAGMLKDRRRFLPPIDAASTDGLPDPELHSALLRLSPKQRASVFLHYYAGYPPAEIAALIGSTQAAVRVHLFRGRARLRDILTAVVHD